MGASAALVDRLQDTVERLEDSLEQQRRETTTLKETIEQQRKQNLEERRQWATLNETVDLQEKQLKRLEESMYYLTTPCLLVVALFLLLPRYDSAIQNG